MATSSRLMNCWCCRGCLFHFPTIVWPSDPCILGSILGSNKEIYWGYIGIMEKKMETTMIGCIYIYIHIYSPWGAKNAHVAEGSFMGFMGELS